MDTGTIIDILVYTFIIGTYLYVMWGISDE